MFGRWLILVFALISLAAFVLSELSRRVVSYSSDAYVTTDVILIAPVVSGQLANVAVGDNEVVAAGDLLAQIDPEPFIIARDSAKATLELTRLEEQSAKDDVASAEASVNAAKASLTDSQNTYDRIKALADRGVDTKQQLDDAAADLETARAKVQEAETNLTVALDLVKTRTAGVKQAAVTLQREEWELAQTRIIAPTGGRIAPFEPRTGAYATEGDALLALVSNDNWRIVVNLPEQNLAHLAVGQRAWVMVASSPWRLVPGRVKSIAPGVARSSRTPSALPYIPIDTDWVRLSQRFPVEIVLDDPVPIPLYRGTDARILIHHTAVAADSAAVAGPGRAAGAAAAGAGSADRVGAAEAGSAPTAGTAPVGTTGTPSPAPATPASAPAPAPAPAQ